MVTLDRLGMIVSTVFGILLVLMIRPAPASSSMTMSLGNPSTWAMAAMFLVPTAALVSSLMFLGWCSPLSRFASLCLGAMAVTLGWSTGALMTLGQVGVAVLVGVVVPVVVAGLLWTYRFKPRTAD